jgi:hypothetical protein
MMRLRILLANRALGGADTEYAIDAPEGRREASLFVVVLRSQKGIRQLFPYPSPAIADFSATATVRRAA